VAATAGLAAGGCGAQQPQAPTPEANRVASAVSGIAAACGESYQQHALPHLPGHRQPPLTAARERATELQHVVEHNSGWIYQGQTLAEVQSLAAARLRECGLAAAARVLVPAGRAR
jgi:hypothetical protein